MESVSNVMRLIQQRRSVRGFDKRTVERKDIIKCIEAARFAPSAENTQPWRFIVLDEPSKIKDFGNEVFSGVYRATRWAMRAPVIVVLLADVNSLTNWIGSAFQRIPFYLIDIGIAGEHFILQARELGLGTCWIGWFNIRKANKILRIPRGIRVCELIAVGYPDDKWVARSRKMKELKDIVFFNQWGSKSDDL